MSIIYQKEVKEQIYKLASTEAKNFCQHIVDTIITQLENLHKGSSPEDFKLKNLWEEICFQVQCEESIEWDLYQDTICDCIEFKLYELTKDELLTAWIGNLNLLDEDFAEDYDEIISLLKENFYNHIISEASYYTSENLEYAIKLNELGELDF